MTNQSGDATSRGDAMSDHVVDATTMAESVPPKPFCLCVVKQRLRRERCHKAIDRLCYTLKRMKDDTVALPELRDRVVEWLDAITDVVEWLDAITDMETQLSMGGRDE